MKRNNMIILIIIIMIIYFSIVGVLGFIIYKILIEEYPLIGLLLGLMAAACMLYWFKDAIIDIDPEPLPKSVFYLMIFTGLAFFWQLTLALFISFCASYLFANIIRLVLPVSKTIVKEEKRGGKRPLDFIDELRRITRE